ncbi:MFS transporter [Pararoseomonas indoligenes]|uniref:MFS transporter n=1 Tax=Roseomonas indoligenes TaxID=2820811 RepID=A0A940S7E0_9PROT|nr:MFS transporter [Pararoseomonas indoligenes]MBP0494845.1 MFS transporter [Pararoseomonas indoligenes]
MARDGDGRGEPSLLRTEKVLLPLMVTTFAGSLAMMAFVALIGPIARVAGLQPWQAGLAVTASGVMWMLGARPWGLASDRHGRRAVLLTGAISFAIAYSALCLFIHGVLQGAVPPLAAFIGLVIGRALVGGAYAAIPAAGGALVADRVPPGRRASAMALLGTGSGAGLVLGPAIAALLVPFGLSAPLIATAALPFLALLFLLWRLPAEPPQLRPARKAISLLDPRLRHALAVGFTAMFSVAIAQVSIGFYALDRLGLSPEAAARAASTALMLVGVALVISQSIASRLRLAPERMIAAGTLVAGIGFGAVALANQPWMLSACYFVAAAGMGWVFPGFTAMAANSVDASEQGGAAGAAGAAQGLGMVVGPVAGSLLYMAGPALPYLLVGLMLLGVSLSVGLRAPRAAAVQGPVE